MRIDLESIPELFGTGFSIAKWLRPLFQPNMDRPNLGRQLACWLVERRQINGRERD